MANISLVLGVGSQGPSVVRAQQLLAARGYKTQDEPGLYGPSTEDVVRAFQVKNNLRVDGSVGPEVWRLLERDEAKEQAATAAMNAARAAQPQQPAPAPAPAQAPQPMSAAAPAAVGAETVAVTTMQQPGPTPVPAPTPWGKILGIGALVLVGWGIWKNANPDPTEFGAFEDDYGLPPADASGDDYDVDDEDVPPLDTGAPPAPGDGTGIVPFGGGPPLRRGPGGKFLPRGGRRMLAGS